MKILNMITKIKIQLRIKWENEDHLSEITTIKKRWKCKSKEKKREKK